MAQDNGHTPNSSWISVPRHLTLQLLLRANSSTYPSIAPSPQLPATPTRNEGKWQPFGSQICRAHKHYVAISSAAFKLFNLQFPRRSLKLFVSVSVASTGCCCCWCYIYLFLLTALYFIYYIEFMSLCCHDQFTRAKLSSPSQAGSQFCGAGAAPQPLPLARSQRAEMCVCAIIVKSAYKASSSQRRVAQIPNIHTGTEENIASE